MFRGQQEIENCRLSGCDPAQGAETGILEADLSSLQKTGGQSPQAGLMTDQQNAAATGLAVQKAHDFIRFGLGQEGFADQDIAIGETDRFGHQSGRLMGSSFRAAGDQVEALQQSSNAGSGFADLFDAEAAERTLGILLFAQGRTMLHKKKLHFHVILCDERFIALFRKELRKGQQRNVSSLSCAARLSSRLVFAGENDKVAELFAWPLLSY